MPNFLPVLFTTVLLASVFYWRSQPGWPLSIAGDAEHEPRSRSLIAVNMITLGAIAFCVAVLVNALMIESYVVAGIFAVVGGALAVLREMLLDRLKE